MLHGWVKRTENGIQFFDATGPISAEEQKQLDAELEEYFAKRKERIARERLEKNHE